PAPPPAPAPTRGRQPRAGSRARPGRIVAAAVGAVILGALAIPAPALADTVRGLSWHLGFLRISQAHRSSQGAGVVVAVIDTGVDVTHQDLQGQVVAGTGIGSDAA